MEKDQEQIERLRAAIERMVGRKIKYPKDFEFLNKQIEGYLGETVSVSTIKRIWGYVAKSSNTSVYTLNLLSKVIGYEDWNDFCQDNEDGISSSHRIICRKLFTTALTPGDLLSIVWKPERKIIVRFEGQDLFIVLESQNSKLAEGDLFHCVQFIEKQPLFLSGLYRKGMPPCDYICGRQSGIEWEIIEQAKAQ